MEFMGSLMALRQHVRNGGDPAEVVVRYPESDPDALERMNAVAEAIKELAEREQVAPVINIAAPEVTVEPAQVNVSTPEVVVNPKITVESAPQAKRTKRSSSFVLDDAGRIVGKEEVEEREDG
jgi:hypothetical protein